MPKLNAVPGFYNKDGSINRIEHTNEAYRRNLKIRPDSNWAAPDKDELIVGFNYSHEESGEAPVYIGAITYENPEESYMAAEGVHLALTIEQATAVRDMLNLIIDKCGAQPDADA